MGLPIYIQQINVLFRFNLITSKTVTVKTRRYLFPVIDHVKH